MEGNFVIFFKKYTASVTWFIHFILDPQHVFERPTMCRPPGSAVRHNGRRSWPGMWSPQELEASVGTAVPEDTVWRSPLSSWLSTFQRAETDPGLAGPWQ